jgi:two-component system C4-dicarboxylate transport sensor histidine kinase DctB
MVRGNIAKISQMADRAGRIIRNLRAFARKEDEKITDVDLVQVVNDAISLSQPKLSRHEVTLNWTPPAEAVHVRGGKVRLQQVIMNLVNNATDAMAGQRRKRAITITVKPVKDRIHLKVRDTGPGLAKPDQVFDPFYTTKTVGEGLGLGLSISYGIVQSFGGEISGENHAGGGATFTVRLTPSAQAAQAAE